MAGRAGTTGIELLYLPKAITVPAGDSTFVLKNQTQAPHNMVIGPDAPVCTAAGCEFGANVSFSDSVAPNSTDLFVAEGLTAGKYSFWCSIEDHAQLGMVGVLTVEP